MSNVEHSTITDPNVHEPKGIVAATANQLYVSDGSGSGAWTDAGDIVVTTSGSFNSDIEVIRTESSAGFTNGNAWEDRTTSWTTTTNNIGSASVSSYTISLPSGTYAVEAVASFYPEVNNAQNNVYAQLRLRDVTSNTTLVKGMSLRIPCFQPPSPSVDVVGGGQAILKGRFTIASTKNVRLQQYITVASELYDSATAALTGETPPSSWMRIWKIS